MIRWTARLILLAGLILVACVASEQGEIPLAPNSISPSTIAVQEEPPSSTPHSESSLASTSIPPVIVKTDDELYKQGESVVVTIENNLNDPIQFMEICSLHLCLQSGEDWICEERECDGPMTVIEPGDRLEILQEAMSLIPQPTTDIRSRYQLDYQIVSEAPFYFAYSNEFTVQSGGENCNQAKQNALEHAQSSPYWASIDATRVTVQWQEGNQSCMVDFAWQGAGLIRAGLWSEGYVVIVEARTGQIIESNAYER